MRRFYETSDAYFAMLSETSTEAHQRELEVYALVMAKFASRDGLTLDLGCGRGISTLKLAQRGGRVVGADLSFRLLQGRDDPTRAAMWAVASAERLPFRSGAFALVGMNSVLEHVTDVDALLRELVRITAPGGHIVLISPNLLTPARPLKALLGRDTVTLSFYGTRLGAAVAVLTNALVLLGKRLRRQPRFLYREPTLDDFAGPDDDATYYCNGTDLMKWLRREGLRVRREPLPLSRHSAVGRAKARLAFLFPDLDKGFCLVAQKPTAP